MFLLLLSLVNKENYFIDVYHDKAKYFVLSSVGLADSN